MLQRLYINNYAIINELDIEFSDGMNVITGETGAGKSIIIGALNLILGERADSSALVNKEKKCVVEGTFIAINKKQVSTFLSRNDLDILDEISIRREIAVNGKSRSFINDTPVNLAQLQELGALLVDLHRQFDVLSVGDDQFQISVLDALAGNQPLLAGYQDTYAQWQQTLRKLDALQARQSQFEKERDYLQFQFDELEEAGFHENELEEAEETLKTLSHAEGIKSALEKACAELNDNEQPIVQQLRSLIHVLQSIGDYNKQIPPLTERLESAQLELKDIAGDLESINSHIRYDPQKAEELQERLSLGYRLQKKHGVNSGAELLSIRNDLEKKLQAVLHLGEDIEKTGELAARLKDETIASGKKISLARKKVLHPFEKQVNRLLGRVGMPNASIRVTLQDAAPGPAGLDEIEFLFDANKSGQFKPVRKVASGGELSRLMLCIKSLVAKSLDMPTLIYDEIDTGISGEAARQVGIIMRDLSAGRQVICITHQPQIAGRADTHFFVYKEADGNTIRTGIRVLGHDERITAIAKMLGGAQPTAAALQNAKEMVYR
jgi:DNA repair protein RecN (Recombination protein N)